ncbi:helix-turn-helix domain-containing protein [Ruminococcus flavefaciens]|uniref:helix-turn-helix domain-containing protein n=1 Tax=Ruminococcus flavefaciens TaxID=1265 RepID=UPI00031E015D|nr:helix-turn-helix transcriptional regulator [Ruminococcus flavefaciens]
MKKLCDLIKQKRKEADLTQEKLSELMGVSLNAVQNWESGRTNVNSTRLPKLSEVFQMDLSELQAALNDDGEDYPNWPEFMFSEEQNMIISSLRLTSEHKELIMLLRIYNSDNWDRSRSKPLPWYSGVMSSIRRIPYKYTEDKGPFKVYELALHVSNFFRYIPPEFCFEVIRANPNSDFDIRKLDKKDILTWMDYNVFKSNHIFSKEQHMYTTVSHLITNFDEEIIRKGYTDSYSYPHCLYDNRELTKIVLDETKHSSIVKLTEKGALFKEWCKGIYSE